MKKVTFNLLTLIILMTFSSGQLGMAFTDGDVIEDGGLENCEDSIVRDGETITVKVCNRRTSALGRLMGVKCNVGGFNRCTFTNS